MKTKKVENQKNLPEQVKQLTQLYLSATGNRPTEFDHESGAFLTINELAKINLRLFDGGQEFDPKAWVEVMQATDKTFQIMDDILTSKRQHQEIIDFYFNSILGNTIISIEEIIEEIESCIEVGVEIVELACYLHYKFNMSFDYTEDFLFNNYSNRTTVLSTSNQLVVPNCLDYYLDKRVEIESIFDNISNQCETMENSMLENLWENDSILHFDWIGNYAFSDVIQHSGYFHIPANCMFDPEVENLLECVSFIKETQIKIIDNALKTFN